MGLFEDFSDFLEIKLDEFLNNNPELKLEVLLAEIKTQKEDTQKLIIDLNSQRNKLDQEIVSVGQEIQTWHSRIEKAKQAGRLDLEQAAQQKENSYLRLGNLIWNERANLEKRLNSSKQLLISLEEREKEVQTKFNVAKAQKQYAQNNQNFDWNQKVNYNTSSYNDYDLEREFEKLETDQELAKMKKNLNL